jgi:hypothetical protein
LYANPQDKWSIWVNDGGAMLSVNGPTLAFNTWTHVVATFDGSNVKLYVNGQPVATGTSTSYAPNTSKPFTVGRGESSFYFNGRLDEVAYYNKVLSAAQILSHYNSGH